MTASTLLTELCQTGITLRLSPDRLRILVPKDVLTPDLRQSLLDLKPQLIRLIELADEYRLLLRRAWSLTADGGAARDEERRFAGERARLTDELGPALAAAVVDAAAGEWEAGTRLCPSCDGSGHCHECAGDEEE